MGELLMSDTKERKYKKSDKDVRSALWQAYDKKDYYKGTEIEYRELEVDHIVPEEVFRDEERKRKTFKELKLEENFEKDSLENYVPTRRNTNSQKKDNVDYVVVKMALDKAKQMKPKVEKLIEEYNKETDMVKAATITAILATNDQMQQDAADIIFDEVEEFDSCENTYGEYFVKCLNRVKIYGKLPTFKENKATCTFSFKATKLRDCTIVVNHEEIFGALFVSNGEYDDLVRRPFVHNYYEGKYTVCLGRCVISLNETETIELCKIIDEYQKKYFEYLNQMEQDYMLGGMKVNERGKIKVCTVEKEFCRIVFDFIRNSRIYPKWNIFEQTRGNIKVYTDSTNKEYQPGYHTIIDLENAKDTWFWNAEGKVDFWLSPDYANPHFSISHETWWSPEEVKKWLFEELFPISLKEYYSKNKTRVPRNFDYVKECTRFYGCEVCEKIEVSNAFDMEELYRDVCALQEFYAISNGKNLKLKKGSAGLYKILKILMEKCTRELYLPYIASKLGIIAETVLDNKVIYQYIDEKESENEFDLTYLKIELLLRCVKEVISAGKPSLSQNEYISIWQGMEEIISEYNYQKKRNHYMS